MKHSFRAIKKGLGDLVMFCVFVINLFNFVATQLINSGIGVGHDDGGVGSDE